MRRRHLKKLIKGTPRRQHATMFRSLLRTHHGRRAHRRLKRHTRRGWAITHAQLTEIATEMDAIPEMSRGPHHASTRATLQGLLDKVCARIDADRAGHEYRTRMNSIMRQVKENGWGYRCAAPIKRRTPA